MALLLFLLSLFAQAKDPIVRTHLVFEDRTLGNLTEFADGLNEYVKDEWENFIFRPAVIVVTEVGGGQTTEGTHYEVSVDIPGRYDLPVKFIHARASHPEIKELLFHQIKNTISRKYVSHTESDRLRQVFGPVSDENFARIFKKYQNTFLLPVTDAAQERIDGKMNTLLQKLEEIRNLDPAITAALNNPRIRVGDATAYRVPGLNSLQRVQDLIEEANQYFEDVVVIALKNNLQFRGASESSRVINRAVSSVIGVVAGVGLSFCMEPGLAAEALGPICAGFVGAGAFWSDPFFDGYSRNPLMKQIARRLQESGWKVGRTIQGALPRASVLLPNAVQKSLSRKCAHALRVARMTNETSDLFEETESHDDSEEKRTSRKTFRNW